MSRLLCRVVFCLLRRSAAAGNGFFKIPTDVSFYYSAPNLNFFQVIKNSKLFFILLPDPWKYIYRITVSGDTIEQRQAGITVAPR